jgi:ATP-dependent helicase YprA (DUF1998 family)
VGYAEKIFDRLEEALDLCRRIVEECECAAGCPACIPPLPPGVADEELENFLLESDAAIECTRSLLAALLDGRVVLPEVTMHRHPRASAVEPPPEDPEALLLRRRLDRAARVLDAKRKREH